MFGCGAWHSLGNWLTLRTTSCRWRSERRILHLKPRRGGSTLAQGNALGNAVQISPSPERAFQSQSAIAGYISAPFQGLDSFCDANPGRLLRDNLDENGGGDRS